VLSKDFNNVLPLGCRQRTPDQQCIYVEAGWTQIDIYRARRLTSGLLVLEICPDVKPRWCLCSMATFVPSSHGLQKDSSPRQQANRNVCILRCGKPSCAGAKVPYLHLSPTFSLSRFDIVKTIVTHDLLS
jgi:hypothetical protein